MSVEKNIRQLQEAINRGNTQAWAAAMQALGFGDMIRALPTYLRKKNPNAAGTNAYNLATLHVLVLPEDAKAHSIERTTVRAGGATGEFTAQAYGATPATTQVAVTPSGDIAFLAADAITDADLCYIPEKGDVAELTLSATAANEITLPTPWTTQGVVLLTEVEVTKGTATGKKIILVPNNANPAAGRANLDIAKGKVLFQATDAVTEARLKVVLASKIDVNAVLESETTGII